MVSLCCAVQSRADRCNPETVRRDAKNCCSTAARAIGFEDIDHFKEKVNDPDLDVSPDDVLVFEKLRAKGLPGLPGSRQPVELPPKILAWARYHRHGSDFRCSDERYGLRHGGTGCTHRQKRQRAALLALVRDGDVIELDVAGRGLHLEVSDEELERRRAEWSPPTGPIDREL